MTGATIANGATGASGATGSTGADGLTPLDLLAELVAHPPAGCDYAEARWVDRSTERLRVGGGAVERVDTDDDVGVGIRVAVAGRGFGFAATRDVTKRGLERALARAVELAAALPAGAARPWLDPLPPARGHWRSQCEIDPFARSLDDRLELLLAADAAMRGDPRIVHTEAQSLAIRTSIAFASSEGAAITQERIESGGGIAAHAAAGRRAPDPLLPERPRRLGRARRLRAPARSRPRRPRTAGRRGGRGAAERAAVPAGRTTLVLGDEQLALQVHESIGHALELDRILLGETSYAGASWVSPGDIGTLRYGSELLAVSADATLPRGLGSFGWDDEGVAAQRVTLIDAGILRATLSDRMSAATIGTLPSGAARADGFARQPIVRMTNVSIEPGDAEGLEELLDGVREGLYMETNRSWSIDDQRLHFQFGTEIGREIRNGKLGRLVRNPTYAGVTPRFWGVARRGRERRLVAGVGPDELRQGRARSGGPCLPRRRSGALSRRRGRRARVNELELADARARPASTATSRRPR